VTTAVRRAEWLERFGPYSPSSLSESIDPSATAKRSAGRRETLAIVIGSLVAAVAAYIFLQVSARVLGPEAFAPISTLWTLQFLVLAVALVPVEQLATRSRAIGSEPPFRSAWTVGLASAGAVALLAFFNRETLYNGSALFVVLTPLAILTTTVYAMGRGLLAGEERYARYGQVTGGHSLARLGAGAPLLALTTQPAIGGWAIALAPLTVLAWRPFKDDSGRARTAPERAAPFLSGLLVGNGFAQMILLGGPLVVGWLGGSPSAISLTFVVLTLFRAPVAVAAEVLARLLPPFTRMAKEGRLDALRRVSLWIAAGGVGLTVVAAFVASWIGAPVTVFLFGSDYRPHVSVAVWVAAGSVLATVGMALNQILVGAGRTWLIAASWGVAAAIAAVTLALVGGAPVDRVVVAFAAGQGAAVVSLVAAIVGATAGRWTVSSRVVP